MTERLALQSAEQGGSVDSGQYELLAHLGALHSKKQILDRVSFST